MVPFLLLSILVLLSTPVRACIWDRDTLAHEAKGLPNVIEAITGRYERNPPLFYAMRLQRVRKEIERTPDNLDLYDDAGAACDRLGQDDEAIRWMGKKRLLLTRRRQEEPATRTHWYRYYANLGTFRAHRWLRAGAKSEQIAQMKQARNEIAKALTINPDAHFGRERIQLWVMDWIIEEPVRDASEYGGTKREAVPLGEYLDQKARDTKAKLDGLTALSSLIMVGDAWESIDLFQAMTEISLPNRSGHWVFTVRYLAGLRAMELLRQGRPSFHPEIDEAWLQKSLELDEHSVAPSNAPVLREQYQSLRTEADGYQQKRTAYLLAGLQAGRHPDTDPGFWKGWTDTPPSLEPTLSQRARLSLSLDTPDRIGIVAAEVSIFLLLLLWSGKRLLTVYRKRRARKVSVIS